MAALDKEVQAFIVQAHACYRKPSLIIRDVKSEFNVVVKRQQVMFYHPEKGGKSKRISPEWRDLFTETRKAYNEGKAQAGISHQSYRMDLYQRGADFYEEQQNYVLASEMAEKAAKDVGGIYTNRRELTGRGGGPIETAAITLDQWKANRDARLAQAEEAMETFEGDGPP